MQSLIFVQTDLWTTLGCGVGQTNKQIKKKTQTKDSKSITGLNIQKGQKWLWGLPVEAEFSRFVLRWDKAGFKMMRSGDSFIFPNLKTFSKNV